MCGASHEVGRIPTTAQIIPFHPFALLPIHCTVTIPSVKCSRSGSECKSCLVKIGQCQGSTGISIREIPSTMKAKKHRTFGQTRFFNVCAVQPWTHHSQSRLGILCTLGTLAWRLNGFRGKINVKVIPAHQARSCWCLLS